MARRLGQEYKLYVDNGSGVYNPVLGEKSLSIDAATALIDQSAKQDGQYAKQAPGRSTLTITLGGNMILPDATGLERLYTLATTRAAGNVQIRLTPFSGSDIKFAASMYVSSFNRGKEDQDNATFTCNLTLADADPTTNTL